MKKLFTFLILVCAFLAGNAQTTTEATLVGYKGNAVVTTEGDTKTATFSDNGERLLTLTSTVSGTSFNSGTANSMTYKDEQYTSLTLLGASGTTGTFTVTYGTGVTSVTMYIMCNSSTSAQNFNLNSTRYGSQIPAYNSENTYLEVSLNNNDVLAFGNTRFDAIFVIEYTKTLPVTVSDFIATASDVTATTAQIGVTYTVSNASDDATYTLYYKDHADTEDIYSSVEATSTGGTISLSALTAETAYTYEIYLEVNDKKVGETITATFTTLEAPTEPFEINYAQIAVDNLTYGQTIYTSASGSTQLEGFVRNSDGTFTVTYNDEIIIPANIVTVNRNLYFRYNNQYNIGMFGGNNNATTWGLKGLKEGDMVEIAYKGQNSATSDGYSLPEISGLNNLSDAQSAGTYTLSFTYNGSRTLDYNVYQMTVIANGNVSLSLTNAYVAYIKVTPASSNIYADGYYLVGSMTEEYDGGWVPNPSYMFLPVANDDSTTTEDEDDTAKSTTPSKYTLTVGSLSSTDKFYVAAVNDGVITYYSSSSTADTDMTYNVEVPLKAGYTNQLGTESNYLDVTFTLNMDVEAGVPNGLSFTGTENTNITSVVITPGNDKTNQSGTVDGQSISMQTENDAVLIFVYVPNGASKVQYATYNVTEYNATSAALLNDEVPEDLTWKNATSSSYETGAYQISLPTGKTGQLYVRYNSSENDVVTSDPYTFTVLRTTPLAVEAVEAADGPAEYFNLQGVKIANPEHGIFIKVQNGKASKVIL